MVGLLPLVAVAVFDEGLFRQLPTFAERAREFVRRHPELCANVHLLSEPGMAGR
jgi:hypothetical protein